ncbi:unnamed protein product [Toxocara canis]|uniref:WW domain-containing protein n=1 Tax=Toxocara canis TaxID=6265 RepID=A0A183U0M9_TOXCA|nr:unnamed protein product [Toxocara canis]
MDVACRIAHQWSRRVAAARLWREYKTPEGRPYYYNSETKETTWTCPKDFEPHSTVVTSSTGKGYGVLAENKKVEVCTGSRKDGSVEEGEEGGCMRVNSERKESKITDVDDKLELTQTKETPASNTDAVPSSTTGGESELEKAMLATLKSFDQPAAEKEEESKGEGDEGTGADAADEEKELKKRQADKFRELLRDKYNDGKITSVSSWEQAVKYIQHDPRFRILNKVSEKKQLFNAWKVQRQKEERLAANSLSRFWCLRQL